MANWHQLWCMSEFKSASDSAAPLKYGGVFGASWLGSEKQIFETLNYIQNNSRNSMKIFLQKVPILLLILVIISKFSLYYLIFYTT